MKTAWNILQPYYSRYEDPDTFQDYKDQKSKELEIQFIDDNVKDGFVSM